LSGRGGIIGSIEEALAAVALVAPVARAHAQKAEDTRGLPVEVVDAIDAAGLWRVFAPRCAGGCGLAALAAQFDIVRALAYEDASAGWGLFICGWTPALLGSRLPQAGREEVFAEGVSPAASAFNPSGSAQPVDGGWRVTGSWPFGSGIGYAHWVMATAIVLDESGAPSPGPGGLPEIRSFIVAPDAVTLVDDWHVAGLRGTGSMTFSMEDIFVPAHRTFPFFGPATIDEPPYRLPLFSFVGPPFVGMAVGLAQRAIDELVQLLPTKIGPPTFQPASNDTAKQLRLGRAISTIGATTDGIRALYRRIDARAAAGEDLAELSLADRTELRVRATSAVESCIAVVNDLFRLGGASSIYEPGALQRTWRDINVVGQHLFLRDSNFEAAAKVAMGIDAESPFL
jgi:alkylation response protein AidB-like acyl-CoA dehydrogenase